MSTSRRPRSRPPPSLIRRIAKTVVGKPEEPRKRLWPDTLTAAPLLPLGIASAVGGLIFRSALGHAFVEFEIAALIVVAGGVAALQVGPCGAVRLMFPPFGLGDESDYPTILCGLPFLAFALACAVLVLGLAWEEPAAPFAGSPVIATCGALLMLGTLLGLLASLLVPLGVAVARALRRRDAA